MADKEDVTDEEVNKEIALRAGNLLRKQKMSNSDMSKFLSLIGYMADGNQDDYYGFMYTYLSEETDWKSDYEDIFMPPKTPKETSGKKFDITAIAATKIIR